MTVEFRGRIIEATPVYALHEPGSAIQIRCRGEVSYTKDFIQTDPWQTWWEAFDEIGKRIGFDARNHTIGFWTKEDYADDEFTLYCGKAPSSSFNLRLKLSGKVQALTGSLYFIDDLYIPIRVAGSTVDPLPAPPDLPPLDDDVKPGPAPPPEPTPDPTPEPFPPDEVDGEEDGDGGKDDKKVWLWVGLAVVAVVGIILFVR